MLDATPRRAVGANERSLLSYALLPRPQDLVKTLIAPASYIMVAASAGSFDRCGEFITLWLILEFLVYYARYQLNDVRGVPNDRGHPGRRLRARLPVGTTDEDRQRSVKVSLIVAGGRVLVAVVIGVALGMEASVVTLILAVSLVTALYETLRSQQPERFCRAAGPRDVAVWITVGLGYAIRSGLGFAFAGLQLEGATMVVGLAFSCAFGTMYVLLSWALEASNFCASTGEWWTVSDELRNKPHIAALLQYLDGSRSGSPPFCITPIRISRRTRGYLGEGRVLTARSGICSPWNVALLFGAAFGGLLGTQLAGLGSPPAQVVAVTVCIAAAASLCLLGTGTARWIVVVTAAVSLEILAIAADAPSGWVIAVPWLAIAGCCAALRSSSYIGSMTLGSWRTNESTG